MKQRKDN